MSEQLQTHSSDCHKRHHKCAIGRLESAWQAQRDAENELSKALAGREMAEAEVRRLLAELVEARRERDRLREAIEGFISSYPWGPCMPELAGLNAALSIWVGK